MRLNIGKFSAKERLGMVNTQLLHLINEMAAAVITLAGKTLSIFIGEHSTCCQQDAFGNDVLRGNELNIVLLAAKFLFAGSENFAVKLFQFVKKHRVVLPIKKFTPFYHIFLQFSTLFPQNTCDFSCVVLYL